MKRRFHALWLVLIAVIFVAGLAWLFRLRMSQGDVFPAYSTLRADPLGTRALYEALEEIPGVHVERSVRPLKKLGEASQATIVLAGIRRKDWDGMSVEDANILEAAVREGARLIVIFHAELSSVADTAEPVRKRTSPEKDEAAEKKKAGEADANRRRSPRNDESERPHPVRAFADWEKRWGLGMHTRWIADGGSGAWKREAPDLLENPVEWKSDLYFRPAPGAEWRVLYTRGGWPVLVETTLGRGSVVVAGDSYFLSNEAMQKHRAPHLLSWLFGEHTRVVFSEAHLGVVENEGVARLARRYGLAGMFFVLVLLAALFVWKRMALFVPPPPESAETALGYHPSAGLESLLRRVLPAEKLIETCVTEWERGGRVSESDQARVREAQAGRGKASPVTVYNTIVRALKRR